MFNELRKGNQRFVMMGVTQKEQINLEYFMFVLVVQEGALDLNSEVPNPNTRLSIKEFQTHYFLSLNFSFLNYKREVKRFGMWLK